MRYPKDRRKRTRASILDAAGRLFRARGVANTGVDAVMGALGMSAGGFYAHFASKQQLVGEAVAQACQEGRSRLQAAGKEGGLDGLLRAYLSRAHRDDESEGCPLAALLSELSRLPVPLLEGETRGYLTLLEEHLGGGPDRSRRAQALLALMVGALALSRALPPGELSDEILLAARRAGKDMAK